MKALVIEDNPNLATSIATVLGEAGFQVETCDDGQAAEQWLRHLSFDLILLDLGLPHLDGIHVLRRLRARQDNTPVLIISARDDLDQRVLGLEEGADDYLGKPFSLVEVVARAKALVRRAKQFGEKSLHCGDVELPPDSPAVLVNGEPVTLHRREREVLEYLLINQGRLVSKAQLIDRLSDLDDAISPSAIETYISRLRKKLGDSIQLRTVRGLGYLLDTQLLDTKPH
ncbi:MAG: response regulator transcription factor [Halomonas sp.]|uniref:Response regulator transcription factor n=1 Tax=Billgrantia tianxiuensis TaxID=2497861 RepID=A0A6I6SJY3_9GAMM|nr:response regulator transcription factor [Halomonas tianxiuensis]MCE8032155.1 response regulator transcription factor [Halomonas sp. MCCC 1A11057]MDX5432056.1 response regulator transcription factor [Halomonas sp.]QHC49822.1 response regulator transcription factor [Halomonas tianxiuensis]